MNKMQNRREQPISNWDLNDKYEFHMSQMRSFIQTANCLWNIIIIIIIVMVVCHIRCYFFISLEIALNSWLMCIWINSSLQLSFEFQIEWFY